MKRILFITVLIFSILSSTFSAEGMLTMKSNLNVKETSSKFGSLVTAKGMKLFSTISHSDQASAVDMELRPTVLIIFGNPKVGTLLMRCGQSIAIDLPLKALIWEDEDGQVWLSYNDMEYLKQRHKIKECDETIAKIAGTLAGIAAQATER